MPSPTRTVLLIDDDELSRSVIELYLSDAGNTVLEADCGDAALTILRTAHPDIDAVLCDMQMPGLHGPPLLRELRSLLAPGTPIVAMSAQQPLPEQVAGFDLFLLKPFSAERLQATLEALLATSMTPERRHTQPERPLADAREPATLPGHAPEETPPVLDLTVFDQLQRMLRPEQLAELFQLSFSELDKHLARMQQAIDASDRETLHHSAHTVKGAFAIVGARELQQLGALLEAGFGSPADQAETLAQIPLAADRLRGMLTSHGIHLEQRSPSE